MRRRPFRRVALVVGLFALFEAGEALVGALAQSHPGTGLGTFEALKRGKI